MRIDADVVIVGTGVAGSVSYTHLDVYKRQVSELMKESS